MDYTEFNHTNPLTRVSFTIGSRAEGGGREEICLGGGGGHKPRNVGDL